MAQIGEVLRRLIGGTNVIVEHAAVGAGLDVLDAGGDFADGVIAYQGNRLGGEIFMSFDKRAVKAIEDRLGAARILE
jgi:predicted nucleic-acid-binding protein